VALSAADTRGVYAAGVTFDRPGYWGVLVNADLQGQGPASATATFEVLAKNEVPAVGDPALGTKNLTLASKGTPRAPSTPGRGPRARSPTRSCIGRPLPRRSPTIARRWWSSPPPCTA
jgi:hypothetical protein